jgi:hypothetical protein
VPALVAPIVGFALGVVLAGLCRAEAPRDGDGTGRARLRVVALFAALVYAPACAYFIVFAGDWSLFYLDDSRTIPSALWLLLVILDGVAVAGGFWAGYRSARRRADRALLALVAVPAALALAGTLPFLARLRVDGTFHQVSARFGTRPVAGGPLGYAILWMGAMIAAGMVIAARALGGRSRPAAASRWEGPPPAEPASAHERPALLGRRRQG